MFDCGEGFVVKDGVGVVLALEEFVEVVHIEAEVSTCGALEEDLQVKCAGVRDVDTDIEVEDSEVVGYINDCILHPALGVVGICGDGRVEVRLVDADGGGVSR